MDPKQVDLFIKFFSQLDGRDQFCKLLQYGSRFWMWALLTRDPKNDLGLRLQALYKGTSTSRKAFRLFKSVDEGRKAHAMHQDVRRDETSRIVGTVGHTALSVYYLFDNLVWLSKIKVLRTPDTTLSLYSNYGWFIGSLLTAVAQFWDLQRAQSQELEVLARAAALRRQMQQEPRLADAAGSEGGDGEAAAAALPAQLQELEARALRMRSARTLDMLNFLKSICNLLVSANAANVLRRIYGRSLNDGAVGVLGCVAALASMYRVWRTKVAP